MRERHCNTRSVRHPADEPKICEHDIPSGCYYCQSYYPDEFPMLSIEEVDNE